MEDGPVRDVLVRLGKGALVVASVPGWLAAAYLLAWFWPGAVHGQTCDLVRQAFCTPGRGMPQYVAVAVLVGLASLLLLTAVVVTLTGRARRGGHAPWFASCVCAVLAGAAVTVVPALLRPHAPDWWFVA